MGYPYFELDRIEEDRRIKKLCWLMMQLNSYIGPR
jgi:hypothetical protein